MDKTLLTIRAFFFILCVVGAYLVCYTIPDWDAYRYRAMFIGASIGILVILIDIFLKGFSLRGMTALSFGLFLGWLMAVFISESPLFERAEEENIYLVRLALFVILMYLGAVVALRGRDEFNLVIPYMRFVPHGVEVPLCVIDTSALIDGRIVGICESRFMSSALVVPRFVLDELHAIADSRDPQRQARGRKGVEVLNQLRRMSHIDLRFQDSDIDRQENAEMKLIFIAQSLKARLLTTDYNLAQIADFHGVEWLNLNSLAKALHPDLAVGEIVEVELVKKGRESGQAVGFLPDGSMVVVNDGRGHIGQTVQVEVKSILPSAGGKMVFGEVMRVIDGAPENGEAST